MFLQAQLVEKGERVEIHNRFIFYMTGIWALWPKFFTWLFNYRAHKMWIEDREIIEGRNQLGQLPGATFNDETCLPPIDSCHQEVVKNMKQFKELFIPSEGDYYSEFFVEEDRPPNHSH